MMTTSQISVGVVNALAVMDAYKSYDGKVRVLDGLNMSVKEGAIYGLLGPSGCGKSTLLNSIVGLVTLDHGKVETIVKSRKDLGFMPQQISLYQQMSIDNVFNYYSAIYDMKKEDRENRKQMLTKLLDLPNRESLIKNLSGGQQRRVSLAVALIHDPLLLILDEPTVGVDPLLRTSIWEYLVELCTFEKKTIVITTHYIEETRMANTVGLMRGGVLLCEASPMELMMRANSDSIEESFLRLSQKQEEGDEMSSTKLKQSQFKPSPPSPLALFETTLSWVRMKAELQKNFLFLWRNIAIVIYLFLLPASSIGFFNYGNGVNPTELKFGVVNDELPYGIDFCDSYKPSRNNCDVDYISCLYLNRLKTKSLDLIGFDSLPEGLEAVKSKGHWGVIHFGQNYSTSLKTRIEESPYVDEDIVEFGNVDVHIDRSNSIINDILQRDLYESFAETMVDIFVICGWNKRAAKIPVKFETPVFGKKIPDFRDFIGPALMLVLLFGMPMVYGTIIVIEEKNCGATGRSLVAGVTVFEVTLSHTIIQLVIQTIQTASAIVMMYYILFYSFQCPLQSLLLMILQGFAGVGFAIVLSLCFDSVATAASTATGIMMSCIILGGMMWPYEGIHPAILPLSAMLPTTLPSIALRNLTIKGWNITHPTVYPGFIVCILWTIAFVIIAILILKKSMAKLFLSKSSGL